MDQTLKYNIVGDASSLVRASETAKQAGASLTAAWSSGFKETTVTIQRSADAVTEMQARINRMVGIASSNRGLKEWTGALAKQGEAAKLTSTQLLNLSRQGNDVVTMFALGASPMQVFASQAGQIYDALEQGPGGLKGSLAGIGEGLLGLATRFPVVTGLVAAAGVAFAAYAAVGGSQIKSLDEILKSHEGNIKALGDAYDQVSGKQQKYAALTARSVNALNANDLQDAKDLLATQIKSIFDSVETSVGGGSGQQGPLERVMRSQFEPFKQALADLGKTSDVSKFIDEINRIAEIDPALSSARDSLVALALEAADTAAKIPRLGKPISELVDIVDQFNRQIDDVTAEPIRKALQDIFDSAKQGNQPLETVIAKLNDLENANPTFVGIIEGFRKLIEQANAAANAVANINLGGTRSKDDNAFPPTLKLPDNAPTPDDRPNAEDVGAANDKRLARAGRGADRAANAYRDLVKSAQDRIKQMQIELDLTGQVGMAADTLRNYQELLSRATDRGRTVSESQKKELHALAEAMAVMSQKAAAARLQQDVLFERDQLGRSDIDQQIADMQRSAGLPVDLDAASAGLFRVNEQIRTTQDAWRGFGDSAADALGKLIDGTGTWKDALRSLIPALEDLIMQLLKAQSIGAGGSGDFSLGGLLSSVFGGGGGGLNVFPGGGSLNSTGGLYAKGAAFSGGNVVPFARGGIVNRPTMFPMSGGRSGLMGEAGEEGILPLRRTSSGHLGVMASGAANSNSSPVSVTLAPVITVSHDGKGDAGAQVTAALNKFKKEMTPMVVKAIREAKTNGLMS